ncbi:MAG TPA: hypothetical protein VLG44_01400 [Chlamydiales bacterium]|nr:hypothetical protein [Chlamydiales bacterium]
MIFLRLAFALCAFFAFSLHAEEDYWQLSHGLLGTKDNAHYYRFWVTTNQASPGAEYQLVLLDGMGRPTSATKLWFDQDNKAWIVVGDQNRLLVDFELRVENAKDAEYLDLVLADKENKVLTATRICPKPVTCTADDGAIIVLLLHTSEKYELRGFGFQPNESLLFEAISGDEQQAPFPFNASEKGVFFSGIVPQVMDKTCGSAKVIITRLDGTKMELNYTWGEP